MSKTDRTEKQPEATCQDREIGIKPTLAWRERAELQEISPGVEEVAAITCWTFSLVYNKTVLTCTSSSNIAHELRGSLKKLRLESVETLVDPVDRLLPSNCPYR